MFKNGFWKAAWLLLLAALGAIAFSAIVVDTTEGDKRFGRFGRGAVLLAKAPWTIEDVLTADRKMFSAEPERFDGPAGWRFEAAGMPDGIPGHVLLSRFDGERRRHVVELYDLNDFALVHRWEPDADLLLADAEREGSYMDVTTWTKRFYRALHPLLLENGDLIFKDHYQPLFRVSACGERIWMKDDVRYHHSTEPDGEGGFWIPTLARRSVIPGVNRWFYEDILTRMTEDGGVTFQRSLTRLLMERGYFHRIFSADQHENDPLHLNDIQPVLADGPYWKRGDLFLSVRRYDMVLLYRPSTDEIVWLKEGPWIGQHDVDIVDDHTIALFNNNNINLGKGPRVDGVSEVLFYDFDTDTVSSPFRQAMERHAVQSQYEGLFDFLPTGHLMLEETNAGRLLLFAPSGDLMASYVNNGADGRGRMMGWSRYIPQPLGDTAAKALRAADCGPG